MTRLLAMLGVLAGLAAGSPAQAATTLEFWFGVSGAAADVIRSLAADFNRSQADYRVEPVFKGTYPETLQAGIEAYAAGRPPDIIQVFDVGTGVMMRDESRIVPVEAVMQKAGLRFSKDDYLPAIASYYSKPDGTMLSFPFNASSPILFVNRDILRRAGLDPDAPPATWPELWTAARKIVSSGAATCGYTSAWMTWIHLENFAAWNDLPYASQDNGMAGQDIRLLFNERAFVRHFDELADLAADDVFRYGGRTSEAKQLFLSGECGMYTDSSAGLADIVKAGLDYGTGPLPYDPNATDAPRNTIPGGASLWVFAGHSEAEYRGVAAFFAFLARTDVQVRLHQQSGYLPVTRAAYEATRASGFYDSNPGREQPILQLTGREPSANSRGIRAVNLPQLRAIQDEEIEALLAGQESAQEALDNAVTRGNAAIDAALGR